MNELNPDTLGRFVISIHDGSMKGLIKKMPDGISFLKNCLWVEGWKMCRKEFETVNERKMFCPYHTRKLLNLNNSKKITRVKSKCASFAKRFFKKH